MSRSIRSFLYFFCVSVLFICSNCSHKNISIKSFSGKEIPLCIAMPTNPIVFENWAPLVYESLYDHCQRVGYNLVDRKSQGYTLAVTIKNMTTPIKLVSPDIVLLHYRIKLDLEAQLLDYNQHVVTKKLFVFTRVLSESQDPTLDTAFTDYEYRRLLEHAAPKIERYFRPYLCKAFSSNKP
jgi:hypothetical protein